MMNDVVFFIFYVLLNFYYYDEICIKFYNILEDFIIYKYLKN